MTGPCVRLEEHVLQFKE